MHYYPSAVYPVVNTYVIVVTGKIPNLYFYGSPDRNLVGSDLIEFSHEGSSFINFNYALYEATKLTKINSLNVSEVTNFEYSWYRCYELTEFPIINSSKVINFAHAWDECYRLLIFPLLDTSNGTDFSYTWRLCTSLTSFPLLNVNKGTTFYYAWFNCTNLINFPAGMFDTWTATPASNCFYLTWDNCINLNAQSVENILVSINNSGKSAPSSGKEITIDYNVATGGLTANTTTAITNLKGKGWIIKINNVIQ